MSKNEESSTTSGKLEDKAQKQLIADITREIVVQIAPEEIPIFRVTSEAYFNDPEKTLKGKKSKDEMLGFGVGDEVTFLTPIALYITTEVIKFMTSEVKKTIKNESSSLIGDIVRKMFKKFRPSDNKLKKLPQLTSEQLARVRQLIFDRACQLKLPEAQAQLLADSLVGAIAIDAS